MPKQVLARVLGISLAVAFGAVGCGGAAGAHAPGLTTARADQDTSVTANGTDASAFASAPTAADGTRVILDRDLTNIVYGTIALSPSFSYGNTPISARHVRVVLSGAQCGASVQAVNVSTQLGQVLLQPMQNDGNGQFEMLNHSFIYQIQFALYQAAFYPVASCHIRVLALDNGGGNGGASNACQSAGGQCVAVVPGACANGTLGDANVFSCGPGVGTECCFPNQDPPAPTQPVEKLAGWIYYNGGFVPQVNVPIAPAQNVASFRIAVPTFCQADVVTAQVVRIDGSTESATAAGAGQFTVPDQAQVSAIALSLNGPVVACQIPVYIKNPSQNPIPPSLLAD